MKNRHLVSAALTAALALPGLAQAADQNFVEKLAPEISRSCHAPPRLLNSDPVYGVIASVDLGRAIYKSEIAPLTMEYDWNREGWLKIAKMAYADVDGLNSDSLDILQHLTRDWADPSRPEASDDLPFEAGGVRVENPDGTAVAADRGEAVLAAILSGDDQTFVFRCHVASDEAEHGTSQGGSKGRPRLVITKEPDDLTKDASDRPFAEFAYVEDRVEDTRTRSLYATAGLVWSDTVKHKANSTSATGDWTLRYAPTVFTQIERESSGSDDTDGVNNLNFGLQLGGFYQTVSPKVGGRRSRTATHYFAVNARYLTDTDFDSKGWSVTANFIPELPIAGNNAPIYRADRRIQARWRLTGIADYVAIDNPGNKSELLDAPEFTRLGYDFTGEVKYYFDKKHDQALAFGVDYASRTNLASGPGDADLLSVSLAIEPAPNFSFGIVYEKGENLDSLEDIDTLKLTFGYRH